MLIAIIVILIVIQVIAMLLMQWAAVVAFLGLMKKRQPHGPSEPKNRFAIVVCAHNEANVLEHLLKSMAEQDYPKDLWHVYVLADHCTDGTAGLTKGYPFATSYERNDGPQTGKGDVLTWGIAKLLREKSDTFDAFLLFDADNIAKPDFMSRMNEALNRGETIVQGNRLAGEPYRTVITQWYAIYWSCYTYLFSYPREKLGLSAFLTGTGFAVKKEILQKYGWHTSTITEDVEFAFQQCLRRDRVSFCVDAVCYDEQPSDFFVMMRQLARWCTGSYQIFYHYWSKWIRTFHKKKSARLIDNLALLLTGPCSVITFIATIFVNIVYTATFKHARLIQVIMILLGIIFTYIASERTTRFSGIKFKKLLPGFFLFPIFLVCFTLCSLYSFIFPTRKWRKIEHQGLTANPEPQGEQAKQ